MTMKKRILALCLMLTMLVCMLPNAAFAANSVQQTAAVGISINQTKNLMVGDSKPLILTASPEGAQMPEVEWASTNEAVATVDENGVVTGVAAGLATITATSVADAAITASVNMVVRSAYNYSVGWSGNFTAAGNNNTTTVDLPVSAERIEKVWSAEVGNSTIVIVDDYIYTYNGTDSSGAVDTGGVLYKINKNSGEIVASMECTAGNGYYYSYIIYGGGLIYVGCRSCVMAVDPDSFTLLWQTAVPENFYPTLQFVNNCVVTNGTVLNSTTGEKLATLDGSYTWSNGVERNGLFYIASSDGYIRAFDTTTWQQTASLQFGSKAGAGVALFGNRLYWGEQGSGSKIYSVDADDFSKTTLKSTDWGGSTFCTPVIADGRVYLAGASAGNGVVAVFRASDLSLVYVAGGAEGKIQSSPIVKVVDSDGPSLQSLARPNAEADGNYVIVQDYGAGSLYVLYDTAEASSGSLGHLVTPEPADYAYEQIAFDKTGALYCTNDAGQLHKYVKTEVEAPVITADLSTAEVKYKVGAAAQALVVSATTGSGTLSYKWQSRPESGDWADVSGAVRASFTPSTETVGTTYYRCVITANLGGDTASVTSSAAMITVEAPDYIPGDVDGGGKIINKDVTLIKRHIAKWDGIVLNTDAADVDNDGKITNKDVTLIKRYIAKWDGVTLG